LLSVSQAVKLSTYTQGSEFKKCINITDFETKTLEDDITLKDPDSATGCCPKDYVPGQKMYAKYVGAQIVCGFKDDGSIEFKASSSNGAWTCTHNKCFVWKQDVKCADDATQKLNGCCGTSTKKNFASGCSSYYYKFTSLKDKQSVNYCLTYMTKYKLLYTSKGDDDIKDGVLQLDKLYQYTPCAQKSSGSTTSGSTSSGSTTSGSGAATTTSGATDVRLAVAVFGFVFATMLCRL